MVKRLIACLIVIVILMLVLPTLFAQEGGPPPPPPPPPVFSDEHEAPPGQDSEPPPPPPADETDDMNTPGPPMEAPVPDAAAPTEEMPGIDITAPPMEIIPIVPTGPGINWTMFKCDTAHTGYTSERLNYPLKLAWKYIAEMSPNNPSSPAVADGIVYFCSGRRLYAVGAETGALKWQYPVEESLTAIIKSSPLVGDELVYFGGGDGKLYAVTKDTGNLAWSFVTKGSIKSSPVLSDGVVYVGSTDDSLYAIDAYTGEPKWPGGFRTRDDVSCSPAVAGGLVYFLSSDMLFYSANASTGKIKWSDRVGATSASSSPVISENTVYIAVGNVLQARQAKSGRLKFSIPFSSDITTVPSAANGAVYFGCKNGKLYALTNAGKLKWVEPVNLGAPIYGSPVIAGDTVIVGASKGVLAAVDAENGQLKWKYTVLPSMLEQGKLKYVSIAASPVVSNGTLYVLADDGALHAFRYDMPDTTPPQASTVVPNRDSLIPGAPPIEIAAIIADPGSGIDTNTISMLLDDQAVEYKLIPERGVVWYKTPVTQPIVPLDDGLHTVTLSVSDWAGNRLETKWCFTVDNRIRRAPKPAAQTGGTNAPGMVPGT